MYKNWKNICGIQDRFVKMAISLVDADSEIGKKLAIAFPECFSKFYSDEKSGPIPFSVLLQEEQNRAEEGWELGKFLVSHDALLAFDIPTLEYAYDARAAAEFKGSILLPKDFDLKVVVGDEVIINDKKLVVVENNEDCGLIYFVPAECIDVDTK